MSIVDNSKNKMMIEKIFPKSPTEVLFKMSNYLQRWKILLRLAEKSKVEQMGSDGVLPEEQEASRYGGAAVRVA